METQCLGSGLRFSSQEKAYYSSDTETEQQRGEYDMWMKAFWERTVFSNTLKNQAHLMMGTAATPNRPRCVNGPFLTSCPPTYGAHPSSTSAILISTTHFCDCILHAVTESVHRQTDRVRVGVRVRVRVGVRVGVCVLSFSSRVVLRLNFNPFFYIRNMCFFQPNCLQ